ncbi:MAG: hypothetical protein KF767_13795 [Bdellovibrionaceae bacterium]|nr:hypothetical protein [Pseudobdellovibrionaceae bacterium]
MKNERQPDSGTLRLFVVLGLLTALTAFLVHWALNAPLGESNRAPTAIPASK